MFKLETFMVAVKQDNPTYERVKTSDLHALVAQVTKSIAADKVAAEMRKITPDKWKKYARARRLPDRQRARPGGPDGRPPREFQDQDPHRAVGWQHQA